MNDNKNIYDDFYVVYLDIRGNIIYPTDMEDVKVIKDIMKRSGSNSIAYSADGKKCYKIRIKRKMENDSIVQIIEISNVTEFINRINESSVDEITHLNNRKLARDMLIEYIETAHREGEDFSIILADLDYFKNVNDTYGHMNGDTVLSEVSRIMYCSTRQESYRPQDIVARIGGDEFLIIMKNISKEVSYDRAEKVREDVENHKVPLFSEDNIINYINAGTLSMGLYHVSVKELDELFDKGYSLDEIRTTLLDRCDSALYKSKNTGKNKITVYLKEKALRL